MTNAFTNRFWDLVSASFGDSANRNAPAVPPQVPQPPKSSAPLKAGYYIRPWTETESIMATSLADLRPSVVRINYPAFNLYARVDATESMRLIGLIEKQITAVIDAGATPLIVTMLATTDPASQDDCIRDAAVVGQYYANIALRRPGMLWEIGNEQEIRSGLSEALTPQAYAQVFNVQAGLIRQHDPYARICTAGMSGFSRLGWIRTVLTLCNPNAVGIHPYGSRGVDYAALVRSIGTTLPVWFTEFGIQSTNQAEQTQMVSEYITCARGVAALAVWFCLSDLSADNGETFGMLDKNGIPRPSYDAAKTAFAVARV